MIALRDVLRQMEAVDEHENSIPFSIKVVKYNEQLDTGGDFFEVNRAILTKSGKKSPVQQGRSIELKEEEQLRRNPNHAVNLTRNITLLPSGNIRTIHIHLITRFNGERVF